MRCADVSHIVKTLSAMAACVVVFFATPGAAQDANPTGISVELSSAESLETGCRLSFLAQNATPHDLDQVVFEAVLFDAQGGVAQMTLLDFKSLPAGRLRVRQFQFGDKSCGDISRILINGASTCSGADADASICERDLSVSSSVDMELQG